MGARFLCAALPLAAAHLWECGRGPSGERLIELATCCLLHPEHDLRQFVDVDFARLRKLVPSPQPRAGRGPVSPAA